MSVTVNGSSGLTFNDGTSQSTSAFYGGLGFRNRIINGAMMIDQRNAGASVTPADFQFLTDRWSARLSQASKFSAQQVTTAPSGFSNSLKITSLSSYTVGSGEAFFIKQPIEGLNIADLAWGTVNAFAVTLSFRVYSSLTGTFGGSIFNADGSRSYPFSYAISSANTWTTIAITIPGETTGIWLTTNGTGIQVAFGLGVGSSVSNTAGSWANGYYASATGATSVVGTSGATFYITGVQLEKGSTATSFDYRPYGTELALCQRYFEKSYDTETAVGTASNNGMILQRGSTQGAGYIGSSIYFAVTKRTAPTVTLYRDDGVSGQWAYGYSGGSGNITPTPSWIGSKSFRPDASIGAVAWAAAQIYGHWTASAEL